MACGKGMRNRGLRHLPPLREKRTARWTSIWWRRFLHAATIWARSAPS